jgi:murein L,D-transpeptidase YcbB/YkuD
MIADGHVQDSMRVIVGKPETPTPALKDSIYYATLNPYWHVPADLTRSLIAANVLKQGTPYLTAHGYEVVSAFTKDAQVIPPETVDWKAVAAGTQQIYVREQPGPWNSLGHYKFDLPHGDGIYLHDTPKKELFAQEQRDLSHGCVRLEDAERLAKWLLGKDPPDAPVPEDNVLLPHPVPITISYLDPGSQTQLAALR